MEIPKTTMNASDGHLEEHPESYRPRVFAAIMPPMQYRRDGDGGLARTGRKEREESKVYEILSNGQAIPWPCLPKELCGFDFWVLYVESLGDVTMMRHALGYNGCAGGASIVPPRNEDWVSGPGCDTWEEYPGQPWGVRQEQ